jgi:hypothetical protein
MFRLLEGKPYNSLLLYAKAVQLSPTDQIIETSLRRLERLSVVLKMFRGYAWVRNLLVLGWAIKFQNAAALERTKHLATANGTRICLPVVILAGGTSAEFRMDEYDQRLLGGFESFHGTLIGGGTKAGFSGLVGKIQAAYPEAINTIGYVPARLPQGAEIDPRYRQIRTTSGQDFSPLEALQSWSDIIVSGIDPAQVKLIGINGGKISAFEYRLALLLGARVGVIESSGRAAADILNDPDWKDSKNFVRLGSDVEEIKGFLNSGTNL